jgi:glutamyl/glutaminyl-tRNA synthetase
LQPTLLTIKAVHTNKKLEWMNGQHLMLLPLDAVEAAVTPALVRAGRATEADLASKREWYRALLELLRVRARTVDDIVRQAGPYFYEDVEYEADGVAKHWKDRAVTADLLEGIGRELAPAPDWDPAVLEERLRTFAEQRGLGAGKLFQPLRLALTGLVATPGIFEVLITLGRDRSLRRIERAVATLRG